MHNMLHVVWCCNCKLGFWRQTEHWSNPVFGWRWRPVWAGVARFWRVHVCGTAVTGAQERRRGGEAGAAVSSWRLGMCHLARYYSGFPLQKTDQAWVWLGTNTKMQRAMGLLLTLCPHWATFSRPPVQAVVNRPNKKSFWGKPRHPEPTLTARRPALLPVSRLHSQWG